jgi:prephenate dehydratase
MGSFCDWSSDVCSSDLDYYFYIDLEGHVSDPPVKDALQGIEMKAGMVKVLGSYPRA